MQHFVPRLCSLVLLILASPIQAEVLWQSFSASYLYGEDYRVGDAKRSVFTFEHAASTDWGDSFMFWDHSRSSNGDRTNYGEWAPRLSLCKWRNTCEEMTGLTSDYLLAGTMEMGETATHFLLGVGTDIDLPGFRFLRLNLYRRFNEDRQNNWQITASWALPFSVAGQNFLYDGFIDTYNQTDDWQTSLNWTSQLKWRVPVKTELFLGMEYVYWQNKYGIANSANFPTDESNANLLLKWHF